MRELPKIKHDGREFTFDYRLKELREVAQTGIDFFPMKDLQADGIQMAIDANDEMLIESFVKEVIDDAKNTTR